MPVYSGREYGKSFEQVVEKIGRLNGLLILKNQLTAVPLGGGGARIIKSELDFKMIRRKLLGQPHASVAYVDCKTFAGAHFVHSDLLAKKEPRDHQIRRAAMFNEWGVPSGFIVWFRATDEVAFFTGAQIEKAGPESRFTPVDGLHLGKISSLDLRPIFNV